jgi:hypothetical protein
MQKFIEWINKVKFNLAKFGAIGLMLWFLIKIIICATCGICIP